MSYIHNRFYLKERRRTLRRNSTPQERKLWERLRNSQLGYKFRRQHSIGYYIADFYCYQKQLIIEVDGSIHDQQKEYDIERDCKLESLSLTVFRVSNNAVDKDIDNVLLKIKEILANSPLPSGRGVRGEVN